MSEQRASIIPRSVLLGNPDRDQIRLSPDGLHISFLASVNGVSNVWVGPLNNPSLCKPVTHEDKYDIRNYWWTYLPNYLLYPQDESGRENWHIFSTDIYTHITSDLTPLPNIRAKLIHVSPEFPDEIAVGLNTRHAIFSDVYLINIKTGESRCIWPNDLFPMILLDDKYNVRCVARLTAKGGSEILTLDKHGQFSTFAQVDVDDVISTSPIGLSCDQSVIYMRDSRHRDTSALVEVNMQTGESTTLAAHPKADIGDVLFHPILRKAQAVSFTYERKDWQVLDNEIGEDFSYLRTITDGDISILSRTYDDRYWLLDYETEQTSGRYYLYDRRAKHCKFLFNYSDKLVQYQLAKMSPQIIKSRDGLELVSYLTLPSDCDLDNKGMPSDLLPLVVIVHGGPTNRDRWEYNAQHQFLANRGYAVLSVNYRGSSGFGKNFIRASMQEWGGKMHEDILDAVEWTVKEGIADPQKIAIMGNSYGGYEALIALTTTPEMFACGIDHAGPSNLVSLLRSVQSNSSLFEFWTKFVGDPRTQHGLTSLKAHSPITHVERIQRPLLICHGANDPRVNRSESDQIVKIMQSKGIPVVYAVFNNEGHRFARVSNRLCFHAILEAFLSKFLCGRHEGLGDDLDLSDLIIQAGSDQIPEVNQK